MPDILSEFDQREVLYNGLSQKLHTLLIELIEGAGMRPHSVTTRVKKKESLERKLRVHSDQYGSLKHITDICGARVVTYFADDVKKIAELVEAEFEIDGENSIDKGAADDPERFGYTSIHYVASIGKNRRDLSEYRRFEGLKFEIQIRSILQHAWAEIEHDLQYKSELAVPRDVRRRFARLAGLLELADVEFAGVRDQVDSYQKTLSGAIRESPSLVLVDTESLKALLSEDSIAMADAKIAESTGASVSGEISIDVLVRLFDACGLRTIAAIEDKLDGNLDLVAKLVNSVFSKRVDSANRSVVRGVSLLYLAYVLLLHDKREHDIPAAVNMSGSKSVERFVEQLASNFADFQEEGPDSR